MGFRLGLLVCGHVHPDALDLGGDYLERFGALLGPLGIDLVPFAAHDGQLPASVTDCDGWMTSPSRASVLDDLGWAADLAEFVTDAVRRERPFVGICFGHQLLARALGGRVERAAGGWGVGVQEYGVVSRRWWMDPAADRVSLVASHEDQVTAPPPEATVLLAADYCPVASFELGERCVTLQPHVEFDVATSRRLLELRRELIGPEVCDAALATLGRTPDRALVAGWIGRFLLGG